MRRFECVKCGNCCRQGGDLRLLPEDVEKIARYFNTEADNIKSIYNMNNIDEKLFFISFDNCCPFLTKENECVLNGEYKPFFCENYIPFVDNEGSLIYDVCQGIGQGKEWTNEEIKEIYNKLIEHLVIRR